MEAYRLFANSIIRQIGSQKTAITIGLANAVIFGLSVSILGVFAFLGLLGFETILSSTFAWDWSAYIFLWFSLLMFVASINLIRGAREFKYRRMTSFLLLCLVGIKATRDGILIICYSFQFYPEYMVKLSIAFHIFSFVCVLTHYVGIKYTPNDFGVYEGV